MRRLSVLLALLVFLSACAPVFQFNRPVQTVSTAVTIPPAESPIPTPAFSPDPTEVTVAGGGLTSPDGGADVSKTPPEGDSPLESEPVIQAGSASPAVEGGDPAALVPPVLVEANDSPPAQTATAFYAVQTGTPAFVQNFSHPEAPCAWSGVGGQVFDLNGNPVEGLIVEVGGTLETISFPLLGITGSNQATEFGPEGYEITLANQLFASQGALFLQLIDLTGKPVSDPVTFNTTGLCESSLVLINFVQLRSRDLYLPFVNNGPEGQLFIPRVGVP